MNELKLKAMLFVALIIGSIIFVGLSYGDTKYNPFSGEFEISSPDSELRYNSFQNSWSYQPAGSQLEYNAPQGTWDFAPPPQKPKSSYKSTRPKNTSP